MAQMIASKANLDMAKAERLRSMSSSFVHLGGGKINCGLAWEHAQGLMCKIGSNAMLDLTSIILLG